MSVRNRRRRVWTFQRLESRQLLASDLDAVRVDALFDHAMPGESVAIEAVVANLNPTQSSPDYVVEFRLSLDQTIDVTDLLLDSVSRPGVAPSAQDEWTQEVSIAATAVHAHYYVGLLVRLADSTLADAVSDDNTVAIVDGAITGQVAYRGRSRPVAIRSYQGETVPILDDVPTWLVIHGRNSSPDSPNLAQLATALDGVQTGDQVLVLDWSAAAASGVVGGAGENFIKPVATWAAGVLSDYGITGAELNVVGHSWGAYVGAELAERMPAPPGTPGQVNSLIALDPAIDYPGGSYNPLAAGEVNFARNSQYSWAFYASAGSYGSAKMAQRADESFVVTASDHSKLVDVVADLVVLASSPTAGSTTLGGQFSFERLTVLHTPHPLWRPDSYNSRGQRTNRGRFEAVVTASSDGKAVQWLKFAVGRQQFVYQP